jgi:uncharacterized membrane protein YvlD (DUF360 family)
MPSIARLLVAWLISAVAVIVAAAVVPSAGLDGVVGGVIVAALVGILNALVPPVLAALRLPFTVAVGFLLVLVADALIFRAAAAIAPDQLHVGGFGSAFLLALVTSAAAVAIAALVGVEDDEAYTLRVAKRVARRRAEIEETTVPGVLFLEIDGLALPVLRRAVRDGTTPTMARWLAEGSHRLLEWEPDLSSQTGASQAGILCGSNADIPAFRWVEKDTGRVVTCSNPEDCAEIERRSLRDGGLLRDGGTSRGNLLSGGAGSALLTASRLDDEKKANPGYRAFLANGANVSRTLVLVLFEVGLELVAAARQRRRDVRPRGHRGGRYPLLRAAMCVFVRDLVVFSVLQDMARGAPAVYATFASYDEVAHHSGLERPDTLEALRKLDHRFAMIDRARRHAARPYEIVVLSDHGQTQGATFLQRNGYGLDDLVQRSVERAAVSPAESGDEQEAAVGHAFGEATGRTGARRSRPRADPEGGGVMVLGSGNLGLIYLMERPGRLTLEEIEAAHPRLLPALRAHPHIGFVLVRSAADGPVALGAHGTRRLRDDHVEGMDPLAGFPATAAAHLRRTDGFANAPDILVNSFYDPATEEGCAFEELISFHGGLGGSQTEPFILHPAGLPAPAEPLVGAEAVHVLLRAWRAACAAQPVSASAAAGTGRPVAVTT